MKSTSFPTTLAELTTTLAELGSFITSPEAHSTILLGYVLFLGYVICRLLTILEKKNE